MKKIIATILFVALCSTMVGCNNSNSTSSSESDVSSTETSSEIVSSQNEVSSSLPSSTASVSSEKVVSSKVPATTSSKTPVVSKAPTTTSSKAPVVSQAPTPVSSVAPVTPTKEYKVIDTPIEAKSNMLIVGNTAYEYYDYVDSTAKNYADSISKAATQLEGVCTVYNVVIPSTIGINPSDELAKKYNISNQKNAIAKIYAKMGQNVKTVDIFDTMKAHKSEYLYFRTDHHWTQRGAYYAYSDLMNTMGKAPASIDSFTENHYGDFLGLMYSLSKNATMKEYPDEFISYRSKSPLAVKNYSDAGAVSNGTAVGDASKLNVSSKYLSFINGDNALCEITNPNIANDSACIVVKDSYGNAFSPFMAENYHTVYVVDFRYYTKGIVNLAKNKNIKDVIFINAISTTRASNLVTQLGSAI